MPGSAAGAGDPPDESSGDRDQSSADPLPPIEGPWTHHHALVGDPDGAAVDPDRSRAEDDRHAEDPIRLHYVAAGPEDGEPVLLLHGFPQFWYTWRDQLPALADAGYRAIAPDLRGYNRTERPRGVAAYRLDRLVGDVRGLLAALGHGAAAVVGHDWGGVLGWELAARTPEYVDRLAISNAPHGGAYLRALRSPGQLRRSWYVGWFQVPRLPELLLAAGEARSLESMFAGEPFDQTDRRRYRLAASRPGALAAAVNYYRAIGRATVRDWLGRPIPGRDPHPGALQSREIDVPTLVLWGLQDPALSPRLVEGLDRWVPDLRVERFPGVDHWLPEARPDAVTDHLLSFLEQDAQ